jgi:hypothetical protein
MLLQFHAAVDPNLGQCMRGYCRHRLSTAALL